MNPIRIFQKKYAMMNTNSIRNEAVSIFYTLSTSLPIFPHPSSVIICSIVKKLSPMELKKLSFLKRSA